MQPSLLQLVKHLFSLRLIAHSLNYLIQLQLQCTQSLTIDSHYFTKQFTLSINFLWPPLSAANRCFLYYVPQSRLESAVLGKFAELFLSLFVVAFAFTLSKGVAFLIKLYADARRVSGLLWCGINLFNQTMALFAKFLWLIIDENEEPGHDHRNIPFRAAACLPGNLALLDSSQEV